MFINLRWTCRNVFGAGVVYNGYQGDLGPDGTLLKTSNSWGPRMDGRMINQYLPNGESTPFVPHEDNWKSFYQTGVNSTTNVAVNGGNEKSSFRLSYGYTGNKGVFKNNDFSRHNIAFRGNTELNKVFSIELGEICFSSAKEQLPAKVVGIGEQRGYDDLVQLASNYDVGAHYQQYRDPETKAVVNATFGALSSYFHTRDTQLQQRNENSLLSDIILRAKVTPWLTKAASRPTIIIMPSVLKMCYGVRCGTGAITVLPVRGGYGRGGSTEGNYNFMGMLQFTEQPFKVGNEDFTFSAIAAAELYGNTENIRGKRDQWRAGGSGCFRVLQFQNKD